MAQTEDSSLTILSLAEPLLAAHDGPDSLTKPSLDAELEHYKDLFSKLRFSYVEQVTKEGFLKAIVAHPPQLADAAENARLDQRLAQAKAALKANKEGTLPPLTPIAAHELIQLQTTQLHALPADIQNLQLTITTLKAAQEAPSSLPMLNLPLHSTITLLLEKESELARLDRQISQLQSALPDKKRSVAARKADLEPIESRKRSAIAEAHKAQKKRGQHSLAHSLDERGKWLKSADAGLRVMLQI
jgi:hypothetical protein